MPVEVRPCRNSDRRAYTNTSGGRENATLVFEHLCSPELGVECRRFNRAGQPISSKRVYDSFNSDLDAGDYILIHCDGDDGPCRYTVNTVPA